jgi:hypothetical protein
VKDVGIHVDLARPDDGATLLVDTDLFEDRPVIAHGSEHSAELEDRPEIDVLDEAIR